MINWMPFLQPAVDKVLKFIPNPAERARHKAEIEKAIVDAAMNGALAQLEVNKAEAQHKSIFVAGWRPAVGWVCATALAYSYIISPVLRIWFDVPALEIGPLLTLLTGMLGMGGLRTYEKLKGVARDSE